MEDLSAYTNEDFFDYEVFAKDVLEPSKQENIENIDEFLQTIANIEPDTMFDSHALVKQEFIEPLLLIPPPVQLKEVKDEKKKRNTAASARFRVKKKQMQQEMKTQITKLHEDINNFNNQIKVLEIENRILKNLVFEKQNKTESNDKLIRIPDFSQNSKIEFQYTV